MVLKIDACAEPGILNSFPLRTRYLRSVTKFLAPKKFGIEKKYKNINRGCLKMILQGSKLRFT
jgi:hypothetical protein